MAVVAGSDMEADRVPGCERDKLPFAIEVAVVLRPHHGQIERFMEAFRIRPIALLIECVEDAPREPFLDHRFVGRLHLDAPLEVARHEHDLNRSTEPSQLRIELRRFETDVLGRIEPEAVIEGRGDEIRQSPVDPPDLIGC